MLVGDEIIMEIIESVIDHSGSYSGFLYDGFPRTLTQLTALDQMLKRHNLKIDAVISLVVDEDILIKRMLRRAEIEGRADDADIEVVKKRIETYRAQTEPLIEIFEKRDGYFSLEGNTTIENNFNEICKIIENL